MAQLNKTSTTVQIRDDFYNFNATIPVNEYDMVYSILRDSMQNNTAAENFTAAIFQIAAANSVSPIDLINSFNTTNKLELTASIASYLNEIRKPTTLLGVPNKVNPNIFAARNVLI